MPVTGFALLLPSSRCYNRAARRSSGKRPSCRQRHLLGLAIRSTTRTVNVVVHLSQVCARAQCSAERCSVWFGAYGLLLNSRTSCEYDFIAYRRRSESVGRVGGECPAKAHREGVNLEEMFDQVFARDRKDCLYRSHPGAATFGRLPVSKTTNAMPLSAALHARSNGRTGI